jgi:hypothetical protein
MARPNASLLALLKRARECNRIATNLDLSITDGLTAKAHNMRNIYV